MDLFERAALSTKEGDPLAERMRPRSLDQVLGQEELLGPNKLLKRAIESDQLASFILYGPPGSGKTTLAGLIAASSKSRFTSLSAVLSGVADLRAALLEARRARGENGARTILFVDEIHRWSRAQQDALLDAVEKGVITLIGATTENPSFALNAPLLSRARVFALKPLSPQVLEALLSKALSDPVRGLGKQQIHLEETARSAIAMSSEGDARRALSTLEIAAQNALPGPQGALRITHTIVEEALQHRALLYDRDQDQHYGLISAFIKSMRASDPDAAVYWLVRMLEAGEEPRFLLRRMLIFASEDVGNADPQALPLVSAALTAFEAVGLPEGVLPLTQAASYLACAEKSSSVLGAYQAAQKEVRASGSLPVPLHLLNVSNRFVQPNGPTQQVLHPHNPQALLDQSHLPQALSSRRFYEPTDRGAERLIRERLGRRASKSRPEEKPT